MHILTDVLIGAAIVFGLNRARTTGRRRPLPVLPPTERPSAIRPSIGPEPTSSVPPTMPGGSRARASHLLGASRSARADPTDDMMNAMSGPGVCTPPS